MTKYLRRNINTNLRKFDMSANEDPNHIQKSYRRTCTPIEQPCLPYILVRVRSDALYYVHQMTQDKPMNHYDTPEMYLKKSLPGSKHTPSRL